MSDIEIARKASPLPIWDIGKKLDIPAEDLIPYGNQKAKVGQGFIDRCQEKKDGKLILVTAISPTAAGEGKTTTTVGLNDGLNAIGKKSITCLREPSLGPCFGMKGGAAGGGYAQVIPMEDINLHFTGDFHAIGSAHNLLAAMVDNHLYWRGKPKLNARAIEFKRVVDMNDRSLRELVLSLGKINGLPRESGFDITVASEVMAILCLSKNIDDLKEKLGNITVGLDMDKNRVKAKDLKAEGAMTILLKDAILPNLVQTLENNPAFIHGGPFANIAHGCNSVTATKLGLKLTDYVVTEAGFGADLGAEKFFNIKCQKSGLTPSTVVIVATVRALKMHGGVSKTNLDKPDPETVGKGFCNLARHIENMQKYGAPIIVAINHFYTDTEPELQAIIDRCAEKGVKAIVCKHWQDGSKGILSLAEEVASMADRELPNFTPLYDMSKSLEGKINAIAQKMYGASDVAINGKAKKKLEQFQNAGFGHFPICMAKTQYSFSADPTLFGAPSGHTLEIKDVLLNTGAEFVVALAGDIMRMPGLPRIPAAQGMFVNEKGFIEGLS